MVELSDEKLKSFNVSFSIGDVKHNYIMYGYNEIDVVDHVTRIVYLTHPNLVTEFDSSNINVREL